MSIARDNFGRIKWRIATMDDHMTSMGFCMKETVGSPFGITPMKGIMGDLSPCQQHGLLGNGMHLVTQASWQLYCLSQMSLRDSDDADASAQAAQTPRKRLRTKSSDFRRGQTFDFS